MSRIESLRQTEIEHFHGAVSPYLDVRGLQVTMDDAPLVRGFESLGDLARDRKRLIQRNRTTGDALREVVTLDQFHHEGSQAPAFFEPVDRGDVRMIERGEHFRFALKTRETIRVRRDRGRQNLDRDLTFQPGVGRPKYLTHPAFADLSGDVVDADSVAGSEGQEGWQYSV